ncbi:MAG: dTDP-4-dehydrorhamnose 3,5-epimerase [Candidatus Hydrogenedentes bacterium]|nr:dTDP-4-dehydrorhamnose 3,5-epimerase [Candidatus Hydrogenedentota bacterium]
MRFHETRLKGAFLIELEPHADDRGFFARAYCEEEFAAHGLCTRYPQCNVSYSVRTGTLRGMHLQAAPHEEAKVVRCTAGAIHDVIIDLRPGSSTFTGYIGVELSAENRKMVYIPEGFAHGFLTTEENAEVFYMMSAPFAAGAARGVRWDDPAFGVAWPGPVEVISERDAGYPDFDREAWVRDEATRSDGEP